MTGGLVTRPIKIEILPMVYEWVERRAARKNEIPPDDRPPNEEPPIEV